MQKQSMPAIFVLLFLSFAVCTSDKLPLNDKIVDVCTKQQNMLIQYKQFLRGCYPNNHFIFELREPSGEFVYPAFTIPGGPQVPPEALDTSGNLKAGWMIVRKPCKQDTE
ncbi:MAG TPA: hypothetical protein VEK38_00735 [Candidatus Bathyarchaeia archaeon]|nr:hypothetical protein [Candidatus Bathyarchaeia archaeon]